MAGSPALRTWFSGRSSPEDHKGPEVTTWLGIALVMFSPIGALVALAGYLCFTVGRFSWKVIAGTTAIYVALFTIVGGFSGPFLRNYLRPWREVLGSFFNGFDIGATMSLLGKNWLAYGLDQLWLSIVFGGVFASTVSAYKWMRRATWETPDRRPGPFQTWQAKRLRQALADGTAHIPDGHTVGVTTDGKLIAQTEAEASAHTLVAGGSGAGKTTTMLAGIRDDIRNGEAVVFVDLKGAHDVPERLAEWAAENGREFRHWTMHDRRLPYTGPGDGPAYYDPIRRGDPSRRKDLLIGSQKWDVEYYKTVIEGYLQPAFALADLTPNPNADSFTDLMALLDIKKLSHRAGHLLRHSPLTVEAQQQLYGEPESYDWPQYIPHVLDPDVRQVLASVDQVVNNLTDQEKSGIRNMMSRMQTLAQSTAGNWLRHDPEGRNDIDLARAAHEGWVVVFTLDSARYEETAKTVGGLIIQDIKTLSSELRENPAPGPTHLYVDEFSALGSGNILGLLARARDARIPVTLSTQALADLTKADPAFLDQCLGIVNCFMIHRANKESDAIVLAGLGGKHTVYRKQLGIEMTSGSPGSIGEGAATGSGFLREEEQYVVLPNAIQSLKTGQLVYIANSPDRRVEPLVTVIPPARAAAVVRQARARDAIDLVDGDDAPALARPEAPAPAPVTKPWVDTEPQHAPSPVKGPVAALRTVPDWDSATDPTEPAPSVPAPPVTDPFSEDPSEVAEEDVLPRVSRRDPSLPPLIDPNLFRSRTQPAPSAPAPPAVPTPEEVRVPAVPAAPVFPAFPEDAFPVEPEEVDEPEQEPEGEPESPVAPEPAFVTPAASVPEVVLSEPAPVVTEPAPVVTEPAPVVSVPAPVITEPAPVVSAPVAPQPAAARPAPVAPVRPAGSTLPTRRPARLSAPWLSDAPVDEFNETIAVTGPAQPAAAPFGEVGELAATGWGKTDNEAGVGVLGYRAADEHSERPNVPTTQGRGLFPDTRDDENDWS